MDQSLRDLGFFVTGIGVCGVGVAVAYALRKFQRMVARIKVLEERLNAKADTNQMIIQALENIRNGELLVLAAIDLADFAVQNYPDAGKRIVARIAPHLQEPVVK